MNGFIPLDLIIWFSDDEPHTDATIKEAKRQADNLLRHRNLLKRQLLELREIGDKFISQYNKYNPCCIGYDSTRHDNNCFVGKWINTLNEIDNTKGFYDV